MGETPPHWRFAAAIMTGEGQHHTRSYCPLSICSRAVVLVRTNASCALHPLTNSHCVCRIVPRAHPPCFLANSRL